VFSGGYYCPVAVLLMPMQSGNHCRGIGPLWAYGGRQAGTLDFEALGLKNSTAVVLHAPDWTSTDSAFKRVPTALFQLADTTHSHLSQPLPRHGRGSGKTRAYY
jgi:hypothetical protein